MMPFASVHESGIGTFRTWRDARLEFVIPPKAEVDYGRNYPEVTKLCVLRHLVHS